MVSGVMRLGLVVFLWRVLVSVFLVLIKSRIKIKNK